ncbi:unnamed protein product [Spirodela intermedia]|uniref:Uncharacterized protein n=2 Tax=Spirodela intermedia TaxID=51605 RepID=A0A7I8LGE0_SPIIN|nr:unnamed protein product [Spirodela intermedia]
MAKGRKQVSAHQQRLLESFACRQDQAAGADLPDLGEDEVWSSAAADEEEEVAAGESSGDEGGRRRRGWREGGGVAGGGETAPRGIQQRQQQRGRRREAAVSAPVSVPAWGGGTARQGGEGESPPGEGGDRWMPPHEYLVREQQRRAAGSVLEGVGRTLKGRDMRRLRDAVWNQTGFFG